MFNKHKTGITLKHMLRTRILDNSEVLFYKFFIIFAPV